MIRSLGFMTGWAMVIGILVLIGTGCPPTDPGVRVFLSKAAQGSGCEGCTPSGPALLINDGAVSTDELVVTLAVSGTDAPAEYLASESPEFSGAVWKPYSESISFDLNGSAITRTIYVKTRNAAGESEVLKDMIYLLPRMVAVTAGSFLMGRDYAWNPQWGGAPGDEVPAHEMTLEAYRIGKYEVTNQQFCDVLNWALAQGLLFGDALGTVWSGTGDIYAGGPEGRHRIVIFTAPECSIFFADGAFLPRPRTGMPDNKEYSMAEFPMVTVTWYGAVAFCNWLSQMVALSPWYDMTQEDWALLPTPPETPGFRLPTEAQWERAAAWEPAVKDMSDSVKFNAGKHWIFGFSADTLESAGRCNYKWEEETEYLNPMGLADMPYTSPVGWFNGENKSPYGDRQTSLSRSPGGAYDMSGNVWEWCQDWYSVTWYTDGNTQDVDGPASGVGRVHRGGAWDARADRCRCAERAYSLPTHASGTIGFRLASVS